MKKLLLLFVGAALTIDASAQYANHSLVSSEDRKLQARETPANEYNIIRTDENVYLTPPAQSSGGLNKTTTGGSRWYTHYHMVDTLLGNLNSNTYVQPLWGDSTVKQRFSTGLGTINFSGMGQVCDPTYFTLFNSYLYFDSATTMYVSPTDAYQVDTIDIVAAYVKEITRPTTIVDTLIVSLAVNDYLSVHDKTEASYTNAVNYIPSTQTAIQMPRIQYCDSINNAIAQGSDASARVIQKIILQDGDRDVPPTSTTVTTKHFIIGFPTPLSVPAGKSFAFSYTFKSGDTWAPNVDSYSHFHHFMPLTGEGNGNSTQMPYYFFDYNDHNMSQMQFAFSRSSWAPSVAVEIWNTLAYRQEFHENRWHVVCATCNTISGAPQPNLSVPQVSIISKSGAFPNPASGTVYVPFILSKKADVTITLSNLLGQTVATQNMGNVLSGTAELDVTNLVPGLYIYTVQAGNERSTGHVAIAQ